MYQFTLEKGSKKHACPGCGKRTFVRVIDAETRHYMPDEVGRCDRESKCGYQSTWKQFFTDNPELRNVRKLSVYPRPKVRGRSLPKKGIPGQGPDAKNAAQAVYAKEKMTERADYLELTHLLETLGNYESNSFAHFLRRLFPYDPEAVAEAVTKYKIGTFDGWTSFPVISKQGKFCKAKLMKFDPATGKRLKDAEGRGLIHSLQAKLRKAGRLKADFETDKQVFFGEHLLTKYPARPIAIVESEKTAVIASICEFVFPDMVWLATGSKQWLKTERIARLGRDRKVIFYPDADGFAQWKETAAKASRIGCQVKVSNLIERQATDAEKGKQVDLADYLISEQTKRNNPARRQAFADLIEERLAIMTIDGGLSETEAEKAILTSGYYCEAIRVVCC